MRARALRASLAGCLVLGLAAAGASALPPRGIHKIRHVVVIMQENRSFDAYFGTFPHAAGIPGLAGHPGKVPCIPDYPDTDRKSVV